MSYYHGSPTQNLKILTPQVSNHKKSYVYLTSSEVIATLYMVNNNFYPYGFDQASGVPIYTEYFPDALSDIYKHQKGSLYECHPTSQLTNPTDITCAYVSEEPVTVLKEYPIDNIYDRLMTFVRQEKLIIKPFKALSVDERAFIESQILDEIISTDLIHQKSAYANFIASKFPHLWQEAQESLRLIETNL